MTLVRFFLPSAAVTVAGLGVLFLLSGWEVLFIAALLVLLEVTLSFDNAVVNARVLAKMTPRWQERFLTWGILIAVFGTRFVLPILVVSAVTALSPLSVVVLALFDAPHYAELLESARYAIYAFGASFLLLVALKYFLDTKKQLHWIKLIERHLTSWGRIEALEVAIALTAVAGVALLVPEALRASVLFAGVAGVVLFIVMQGITSAFSVETSAAAQGLTLFLYLNVLDSAFSLDGVVGAFALTSSIPVIAVGLGIGAYFVRSFTLFMVRQRTLQTLVYLEHGAHWAIFGLALSMLVSMLTEVPEVVTGSIGVAFVLAAYYSSLGKQNVDPSATLGER